MQHLSRWLMLTATGLLLLLFAFPLWKITLEAPQFPDGLYMYIWINKISGSGGENIIQNINILNHYIGMKKIEPDAIPELAYFPYIVAAMAALGLIMIFLNKRKGYLFWFVLMLILAALGIYDFYLWEYDYGHNLDPKAPIQVPGMVYQPPLFGRKDLLNFVAYSYPATGGICMGLSMIFAFMAFYFKKAANVQS